MFRVSVPRPLAVLITGLLLAAGLQVPADAAITRAISMTTSTSSVTLKGTVTFSGKLSKSPKGSLIYLQRKVGTRWVNVKSTRTTTTTGVYKVAATMPGTVGTYSFRAYGRATSRLRAAVSGVRAVKVLNKVTVTASASPMTVPAGSNITITGTVKPFVTNSLATVQKLLNGKWTNITTSTISSTGTFTKTLSVGPTTQLRVFSPLVGYNAVGYSPTMTVTTTPVIATQSLPSGTRTLNYSAKLITVDQSAGVWTASPLPPGLTLNQSTGVISGNPTQIGTTFVDLTFQKTATGEFAPAKSVSITINQHPLPEITTTSLPSGTQVSPYSATLSARNAPAGTWAVENLPDGLELNPSTGQITGAPQVFGQIPVTLKFTQTSTGLAAPQVSMNLTIGPAGAPTITTATLPDGMRTLAYPKTSNAGTGDGVTLVATGPPNNQPVTGTWSASTSLPAGLSLNPATGAITGTPTGVETKSIDFTFTQQYTGRTDVQNLTITVRQVPNPVITTTSLTQGTVNAAYNGVTPAVTTVGAPAGTWAAPGLPNGLGIDPATGKITGTPTVSGSFAIPLKFTQTSSGLSETADLNLVIKPVITTSALPDGTRTLPYSFQAHTVGDVAGTWSAPTGSATGALPAGLSISAGGLITGTPTTVGSTNVILRFTQSGAEQPQVTRTVALEIVEVDAPDVTTSSLAAGTVSSSYTSGTPSVTTPAGSNPAGAWSATNLPAGLTISASTGVISGTPTVSGTFSIGLKFTQTSTGFSDTATIPLLINAVISTSALPDGTRTLTYPNTQVAAVGTPAGTWAATNLPAGLSISSGGVISGTPTAVGTKTVTLKFTQTANGGAPEVTKNVSLTINQAADPVIDTTALAAGTVNAAYPGVTLAATGPGNDAGTWTASPLPDGLSLNQSTGAITGTPTASGTTTVTIGFTQTSTGLAAAPKELDLVVNAVISTSSLPDGTRTLAYPSTQVAAVGTPAGTWSATNLPAGLSISAAGVISGTPTTVGTKNVNLRFTQTANGGAPQVTRSVSLDINEAANPTITTTSLDPGTVDTAYSTANLAATGPGNPAGTWTASPLPNGIAVSSAGVFSGTPTAAGSTNVVVQFTQTSTGLTASKTLALAVKPVVTTAALAQGAVGTGYSVTLAASGGSGGTWAAAPRPAGISLNAETGVLSGTPTAAGSTNVVITYTVNGQASAGKTLALVIKPVINTAALSTGTVGTSYSFTLDGTQTGTWSASPLPDGLVLDPDTGAITGTPTEAGSTNVVIGYTVNGQAAAGKTLALAVKPVVSTSSLPNATRTEAYSTTLTAAGGSGGTWTASPLPAGLNFNASTGTILGTPSALGTTNVVVTYTVNGQTSASRTLALQVVETDPPVITTPSLPDGQEGVAYSKQVQAQGGPAGTWSTQDPLPAGLSIDEDDGTISGTPTTSGEFTVVVVFEQTSTGLTDSKSFSLTIAAA